MSFHLTIFCCAAASPSAENNPSRLHRDQNRDLHHAVATSFVEYASRRERSKALFELVRGAEATQDAKTPLEITRALGLDLDLPTASIGGLPTPPPQMIDFHGCPNEQAIACIPQNADYSQELLVPSSTSAVTHPIDLTQQADSIFLEPTQVIPPWCAVEATLNNPLHSGVPFVMHLTSRHDFGPVISHRYFACPGSLNQDWEEMSLVHWFARGEPFKMQAMRWDWKCEIHKRFYRGELRPNLEMRGKGIWGLGGAAGSGNGGQKVLEG